MVIQIYKDSSQLLELREAWNLLAQDVPTRSWEWLSAWWETYGKNRELRIFVAKDESGCVQGIAPFYLERGSPFPQLRLLGSGRACSDYAQPLVTAGKEEEFFTELFLLLESGKGATLRQLAVAEIQLDGVHTTSPWLDVWEQIAESRGYRTRVRHLENAWRVPIPTDFALLPKQLHSHIRRKFKKANSRIQNREASVEPAPASDTDECLALFERLHTARQRKKGNGGCFEDPRFAPFIARAMHAMIEAGTARFDVCRFGDRIIGIQLQLLSRDGIWMYQSGLDPEAQKFEPGHLSITGAVRAAHAEGRQFYDFMRGNESYKAQWGAHPKTLACYTFVPPAVLPRLFDSTSQWLRAARRWGIQHLQATRTLVSPATSTITQDGSAELSSH